MRRRILYFTTILFLTVSLLNAQDRRGIRQTNRNATIHAIFDLSHEFSFYTDGRFATQYLKGQHHTMNWGNLYDLDFSNTNLLVFLGCDDRSPYTEADMKTVKEYAKDGGGLLILGKPKGESQNRLAQLFGVEFTGATKEPLRFLRHATGKVDSQGNATSLTLKHPADWDVIVQDEIGTPVLVASKKGNIVIGSRSLAGSNPNASDSINGAMWKPLLLATATGKRIDTSKPLRAKNWGQMDHTEVRKGLEISYTDYLKPYADDMFDIASRCMPVIEKRMGVPLTESMGSKIILLATDGGGFSSGETIALAVWWGGFPEKEDSMIEFITHESVHSWVLPFAEIWNEPIATYVGNLVMIDMGHKEEAERRIKSTINRAKALDPNFNLYDMDGKSNRPGVEDLPQNRVNDLHWGKSYWIWEQMRAENPNVVAGYFKAKRKYATTDVVKRYDENNTVAVMSIAMGRDLFPWFRDIGFDVDREKADVKF